MYKLSLLFLLSLSSFMPYAQNKTPKNILAHSHNDYEQKIPLYTAFDADFNSIEIDIVRDQNRLRVAHDSVDLGSKPFIEDLYLKPLKKLVDKNTRELWLLIDIKYYDQQTLDLLHETILTMEEVFQKRNNTSEKPLKIILSGDLPRKEIIFNEKYIFFFLDGRPSDLKENYDAQLMPLISTNFTNYSTFKGKGKISKEELKSIDNLIREVHHQNKKMRFWKTRDNKKMWQFLVEIEVDMIGVDHIKRFIKFQKKLDN
ncbi:MAG: hypothetical protein AAFZ15_21445 [Bacteroidota bacterium]